MTILSMSLYYQGSESPVPRWLQKLAYSLSWPPFCFKHCVKRNSSIVTTNRIIPEQNEKIEEESTQDREYPETSETINWKDVSRSMDGVMFLGGLCFIFGSIIITLISLTT